MPGVEIIEINMQIDHIHAIMIIPPKYAVSEVIGRIKGRSSSMLRKKFAWLGKVYWKENVVWSPGYFISTVGLNASLSVVPNSGLMVRARKWGRISESVVRPRARDHQRLDRLSCCENIPTENRRQGLKSLPPVLCFSRSRGVRRRWCGVAGSSFPWT